MYRVARLDFVLAELVLVFHNPARVYEALSSSGDLLVLISGKQVLQIGHGNRLGDGDGMQPLTGGLDLEGDLGIGLTRACLVRHAGRGWMDSAARKGDLRRGREPRGGRSKPAAVMLVVVVGDRGLEVGEEVR